MSWFDEVSARPFADVASAVGLSPMPKGSFGPCPACAATRRSTSDRADRRGPIGPRRDGRGWVCWACRAHGSTLDLAALALLGARPAKGESEKWRELRSRCSYRGLCGEYVPGEAFARRSLRSIEPTAEPAPIRPPPDEVAALWGVSLPVDAPTAHPVDLAFLERRGFPVGDLAALDLARFLPLPDAYAWPDWWPRFFSRAWRLVVRAYEPDGTLAAIHGRTTLTDAQLERVGLTAKDKTRWGRRFESRGLLMANAEGASLLRGEALPGVEVFVGEGLTSLLNMSLCARRAGRGAAVLTSTSGGFGALGDIVWPDGSTVYLAIDDDEAAIRYQRQILASLPGHVAVRRINWQEAA